MECHNCKKRHLHCHSTCESYLNYKKSKAQELKIKKANEEFYDYAQNGIVKRVKNQEKTLKYWKCSQR